MMAHNSITEKLIDAIVTFKYGDPSAGILNPFDNA